MRHLPMPHTLPAVLDEVALLLRSTPDGDDLGDVDDVIDPLDDRRPDLTELFVQIGAFAAQQLDIAVGLEVDADHARAMIPRILGRAKYFGQAQPASVGAVAAMVGLVKEGDERSLAQTIVAARRALGDQAVIAGGVALIAAFSDDIAATLALDPSIVHRELHDGLIDAFDASEQPCLSSMRNQRRTSRVRCRLAQFVPTSR